jgi:uncharacterized protein
MFETLRTYMKQVEKGKLLVTAPILLLLSTYLVFTAAVKLAGLKPGYLIGFLFYWVIWCLAFPLWLLGKEAVLCMFRKVAEPLGRPKWLGVILLFTLPLFTLAYAFPMQLPKATFLIVVSSALIALINATCEEILWRGVYYKIFPGSAWWGYLYPAIWFGLWHYAPQSVLSSSYPGGAHSLVLFAVILGLMWGWVAWKTKSIRWVNIAHIILDFSGLGALFYFN